MTDTENRAEGGALSSVVVPEGMPLQLLQAAGGSLCHLHREDTERLSEHEIGLET